MSLYIEYWRDSVKSFWKIDANSVHFTTGGNYEKKNYFKTQCDFFVLPGTKLFWNKLPTMNLTWISQKRRDKTGPKTNKLAMKGPAISLPTGTLPAHVIANYFHILSIKMSGYDRYKIYRFWIKCPTSTVKDKYIFFYLIKTKKNNLF